jgi:hypothetical protein
MLDWELSPLARRVFVSFLPSIYMVNHLYIYWTQFFPLQWQDDDVYMEWLEILQPFTSVKDLYVCKELAKCFALALKDLVGERVTDVLPALECLLLEELQPSGVIQETIEPFVAARQLLGNPVAVSCWDKTGEHHYYG